MRIGPSILALALAIAPVHPAAAKNAPALAPNGPWILEDNIESCAVRRMFGEGRDQAYLELRRFQPDPYLQATVASNRMRPVNEQVQYRYRFGNDAEWLNAGLVPVSTAEGFNGVVLSTSLLSLSQRREFNDPKKREAGFAGQDWRTLEKEAAAKTGPFTVLRAFHEELSLDIGSLDKPLAALNQCMDDLLGYWGIDAEAHKSLTVSAKPINLSEIQSMITYPREMNQKHVLGLVNVRLAVDEQGNVTACHIQLPLSDPAFEEKSCASLQPTLKFEPALDKDGKPIRSYWVTTVWFDPGR